VALVSGWLIAHVKFCGFLDCFDERGDCLVLESIEYGPSAIAPFWGSAPSVGGDTFEGLF
jgi:hypothetical protein